MRRRPTLSPPTLRFLLHVNYLKKVKKMDDSKCCKIEKEKEIVLIMIYMFIFVKHPIYLGNTYL